MTVAVVQFQKTEEAKFICSACGAERGCQCNAPAVEKLAQKQEQDRQRAKAYRERKVEENQQSRHVTNDEAPGLDGKTYPVRQRITAEATPGWRPIFLRCATDAIRKAEQGAGLEYVKGSDIDDEILSTLSNVVEAWTKLLGDIQNRRKG